jgi:DNA-binding NarL/FixJ family response regulator
MDTAHPIALLIVVPVRLYREGLREALSDRSAFAAVDATVDVENARICLSNSLPDVVLLDMTTPRALELVFELKRNNSHVRVVAFAVNEEESEIMACIEAGAVGYLTCDSSIDAIVDMIQSVYRGELPCSPRVAAMFARRLSMRAANSEQPADPAEASALSLRERQVVRLMCEGLSNKQIAHALSIAEATVKNHVHHLLEKLRVTTRTQAIARVSSQNSLVRRN